MAGKTKIEIRNTSNEVVAEIDPVSTSIDSTTTSINLFGKGVEEYLTEVNENFYALLENFASKDAPSNPQTGQLWYSKTGSNKVYVRGTGLNKKADRTIHIKGSDTKIKSRRGIALMIFNNDNLTATKKWKSLGYYDVYGSNAARTQLARKLGTVKDDEIFIMASWDAIGTNKTLDARMAKLNSKAWQKIKIRHRYPYAAIGTGKFGIISEDLQEYDDKTHAYAQVAFESLVPDEGMGTHTSLTHTVKTDGTVNERQAINDNLLVWNGETWGSSAATLEGKDLKTLRSYILSGVDLSVKFDKAGGTVNGSVVLTNTLEPQKDIVPTGNEIQDLGTSSKRYRSLHLSEDSSIYMGVGKSFNKNSFVYTVEKEEESVTKVPAGSIILNRATGEAIVKKSNFKASTNNSTFRKLSQDKKYGVVIGGNNYSFNGDKGVWMGSWRHGTIQKISIPTTGNASVFGSCRSGGHSSGCSDGTRGLSFWQHGYSGIQYVTISTPMNAVNFGRFYGGWRGGAASDGTRAVTFGGAYYHNKAYYVLFATPMNATHFGNLDTNAYWNSAVSDGSKAIFDRGAYGWSSNQYRYVTMSTPANAIYFGKMQNTRGWTGAASNGTHGMWSGGHGYGGDNNQVEKLTLASPSNSTHFGTLTYSRHSTAPVANETRMVSTGGNTYSKTLDYLSFANGGSSTVFGNAAVGIRYPANFSGN